MVLEHRGDYASQLSAIVSIASKIGCTGETLRKWVRQAERDQGLRDGTTTEARERQWSEPAAIATPTSQARLRPRRR